MNSAFAGSSSPLWQNHSTVSETSSSLTQLEPEGTAMTMMSAQRLRAAYDGLLGLAERETQWEGDKDNANPSFSRFPPVDMILTDLDQDMQSRRRAA